MNHQGTFQNGNLFQLRLDGLCTVTVNGETLNPGSFQTTAGWEICLEGSNLSADRVDAEAQPLSLELRPPIQAELSVHSASARRTVFLTGSGVLPEVSALQLETDRYSVTCGGKTGADPDELEKLKHAVALLRETLRLQGENAELSDALAQSKQAKQQVEDKNESLLSEIEENNRDRKTLQQQYTNLLTLHQLSFDQLQKTQEEMKELAARLTANQGDIDKHRNANDDLYAHSIFGTLSEHTGQHLKVLDEAIKAVQEFARTQSDSVRHALVNDGMIRKPTEQEQALLDRLKKLEESLPQKKGD